MRASNTPSMISPDPILSVSISTLSCTHHDLGEIDRLAITMRIGPPLQKKIAYRAVKRQDGVIVEKPRYRPFPEAFTSSTSESGFVSKMPATIVKGKNGITQPDWIDQWDEHIAGVGAFMAAERDLRHGKASTAGKDCSLFKRQRGRSGYNGPSLGESSGRYNARQQASAALQGLQVDRRESDHDNPVQRFLDEPGPWNPHRGPIAIERLL